MTFIEKFDSLKKKLSKADAKKLTENFAVQINLTDEDCGGAFYIAYMDDVFAVEPYDYHDHTAMVTTDAKTFENFLAGKAKADELMVEGNGLHVELIAQSIAKKTAVRKTAPRKTTAAKTAAKKTVKKSETAKAEKAPAKKTAAKRTTAKKSEVDGK